MTEDKTIVRCPCCNTDLLDGGVSAISLVLELEGYAKDGDGNIYCDESRIEDIIDSQNIFECRTCKAKLMMNEKEFKVATFDEIINQTMPCIEILFDTGKVSEETKNQIGKLIKKEMMLNTLEGNN